MKKPVLLVPVQAVRTMMPNADVDKMLASGSWCRVPTVKPQSANVRNQRRYRDCRIEEGCKRLDLWISKQAFDELRAKRLNGETMIATLERLLLLPVCTCNKS